ncbi:SMC-Scp complex subunit ScpB [Clostridium cylindrosporum]|uniref:Segregation and condensation protein B n=1 Tax=Clostridium cylindrosporum DSM 605 TaxID=1121307 RepID=A0A0J8G0P9_CLOCY|nr:SMC-Scp complex subunit ScpB [Clostridium cylindrosporum]KMT21371.1 segregation and condensation protein B [Clostridium cylindrosporum DSM 605]
MENFLEGLGILEEEEMRNKGIIESLLFTFGEPLSYKNIGEILELDVRKVKKIISNMKREYEVPTRGLTIKEFNGKVQLSTKPEYGSYIKRLIKSDSRQNLSQAALETLALVAYKQPITKSEIDDIRGVRSDRAVTTLLERGLIKEAGRLEATGRPILYTTTDDFLKYFGFKSINELPELIEFNMDFVEE